VRAKERIEIKAIQSPVIISTSGFKLAGGTL